MRTAALVAAGDVAPSDGLAVAEWFMDYRNADGSIAEMCGNGVRVFVAYLLREGLVSLADGEDVAVGTRAGVKRVRRDGDLFAADLGPWFVTGDEVVGGRCRASRPGCRGWAWTSATRTSSSRCRTPTRWRRPT